MGIKRPPEFFKMAWELFHADKRDVYKYQKAQDAFVKAGSHFNVPLSGCMTNKASALSYMMDDVKRKVEKS